MQTRKSARPFHLEVVYLLTPSAEKKESRPCRKRVPEQKVVTVFLFLEVAPTTTPKVSVDSLGQL